MVKALPELTYKDLKKVKGFSDDVALYRDTHAAF